jgi:hypothetical protein
MYSKYSDISRVCAMQALFQIAKWLTCLAAVVFLIGMGILIGFLI